jgi:1-acyl-sn-glycerol-3-phosphate acyltransferase
MLAELALTLRGFSELRSALLKPVDPDDIGGLEPELIRTLSPTINALARLYFRMEIEGIDRVPRGGTLIVGNHNSGITFLEPIGVGARWYLERGVADTLHFLVHDAMVALPLLRNFLMSTGCVRASHKNATRLLSRGKKVVVFPGGNLEAFRPFRDRYKITFGGKKGFIRLALRQRVSITPMVLVGGHETFYVLSDGRALARLLRLKKLVRSETCAIFMGLPWGVGVGPIFHFPLPAKSHIRFLDPILLNGYGPADAENPHAVEEIYQRVTSTMQTAVDEISRGRKYPVLG